MNQGGLPDQDTHSDHSPVSVLKLFPATSPSPDKRQAAGGETEHKPLEVLVIQSTRLIFLMLTVCTGTCTHTKKQGEAATSLRSLKTLPAGALRTTGEWSMK